MVLFGQGGHLFYKNYHKNLVSGIGIAWWNNNGKSKPVKQKPKLCINSIPTLHLRGSIVVA